MHTILEVAWIRHAINKGGTMESLFHPYAGGVVLRVEKKGFFILFHFKIIRRRLGWQQMFR